MKPTYRGSLGNRCPTNTNINSTCGERFYGRGEITLIMFKKLLMYKKMYKGHYSMHNVHVHNDHVHYAWHTCTKTHMYMCS